jgi:hypothetical protein
MSVSIRSARSSRKKNHPASLNSAFEQKLLAYAAAASAAGVAAISLAQPCQAEIIYTKVHQPIEPNSSYSLDLNNDGVVDFTINNFRSSLTSGRHVQWEQNLWVKDVGTNRVWDTYGGQSFASVLDKGAIVGPGGNFSNPIFGYGRMDKCRGSNGGTNISTQGSWILARNKYLGLAFSIDGQIHYGWARLSSRVVGRDCKSTVLLTGYAYETVAGQAIEAGKMKGDDESKLDDVPSSTLGELALGRK